MSTGNTFERPADIAPVQSDEIAALAELALQCQNYTRNNGIRDDRTGQILPGKWKFPSAQGRVCCYIEDLKPRYPDIRILLISDVGSRINGDGIYGQLSRVEDYNLCNKGFFGRKPNYFGAVGNRRYALNDELLTINPYVLAQKPWWDVIPDKGLRTKDYRDFYAIVKTNESDKFTRPHLSLLRYVLEAAFREADADR